MAKEEWVELTDGTRKFVMPRREMVNLSQHIARVFATARPVAAPIHTNFKTGHYTGRVKVESLFEATVYSGRNGTQTR